MRSVSVASWIDGIDGVLSMYPARYVIDRCFFAVNQHKPSFVQLINQSIDHDHQSFPEFCRSCSYFAAA